ncbi:hypothetical protein F5B22DRAFT_630713 [Xylaria bambusicola]|uniref:uncharacterized protein n=1 Tax=Xylaria bambusicola TaxID=326684 RepID=UPI0020081FF2|nr:uncharacterized protein F5B22DRAFT_630713 [Xylaria bambusicola]KAI0503075.1 hypothetical protein F5B22DRAFT_630713 [Xylaria bambusicola]
MADGSCGPSNAFKGLARHIEQDRSHQQDRVAPGPQHQAQGFRSAPLNTSIPDQFGAFQQQNAALPQHPPVGWSGHAHSAQMATFFPQQSTQQPLNIATNAGASWVSDFERMSFASAPSNPINAHPTIGRMMGQLGTAGPMHYHSTSFHQALTPVPPPSMGLHPINPQPQVFQNRNESALPALDALDTQTEAMLEKEFVEAMDEWMRQNGPGALEDELGVQESENLAADLYATSTPSVDTTQAHESTGEDSPENRDELARAAQQLVDAVANNNSEKFKNSDFLALMRRIASQELVVQDGDLVETHPNNNSESQATTAAMATNRGPKMVSE